MSIYNTTTTQTFVNKTQIIKKFRLEQQEQEEEEQEMEVVVQSPSSPPMDNFDFSSGTMSSPYLSAPSSPKRFGEYYLSAPTSPSRISQLYSEFEYFASIADSSTIEAAENTTNNDDEEDDGSNFAFFVSRESEKSSRSAEELFDGGKIKAMKAENMLPSLSNKNPVLETEQRRGRDRNRATTASTTLSSSNSGRRVSRSHSPFRKPHYTLESEQLQQQQAQSNKEESKSSAKLSLSNSGASISSSSGSSKGSRRWSLKDFLLFRSASEGRGSSKDALNKYPVAFKKNEVEVRSSSFRSSDRTRRKGPVSAHEFHYAMKKAESDDMRKKTFLPYKQGILGRLSGFGL